MDFKNMSLTSIVLVSLVAFFLIGLVVMKFFSKADLPAMESNETQDPIQNPVTVPQIVNEPTPADNSEEDAAIQQQLDHDRQQQNQTKDLRIKLEQTNLELEEEKALAEINKLKKENMEEFNGPSVDGQKDIPEIKVDYIGGDSAKKEAILSIGGASYQVKEKSNPVTNIEVVSISDSGVVLHFNAPQNFTKIIDYKPE